MTVESIMISTVCWCCGTGIRVDEKKNYKPYTCTDCHNGKHPASEWQSDEFECRVECGEEKPCNASRTLFLKRKAATELFRNRNRIRCKGCRSKTVTVMIRKWLGGPTKVTVKEGTPIVLAKEWRGIEPEDILTETAEA